MIKNKKNRNIPVKYVLYLMFMYFFLVRLTPCYLGSTLILNGHEAMGVKGSRPTYKCKLLPYMPLTMMNFVKVVSGKKMFAIM